MSRFEIISTGFEGLYEVHRKPISDTRGFLERLYCMESLGDCFGSQKVVQINHTLTRVSGTVRGMHFQNPPHCEKKMVTCLKGRVWDVAVDLRRGSKTFLQSYGVELTNENFVSLLIPEGFAHGFQTLESDCELLYFHSQYYSPIAESGVNALDPRIGVVWPLGITERSVRDAEHPMLSMDYSGIELV